MPSDEKPIHLDRGALTWTKFQKRLERALGQMAVDTYLILIDADSRHFVQFAPDDQTGFLAEAISNQYLPGIPLSPSQEARAGALGWEVPLPSDTTPMNYWRKWPAPIPFATVAALGVRTLREVYGVAEPTQLRYKSFGYAGAQKGERFLWPTLGIAVEDPNDQSKPIEPKGKHELVATIPVSPDWAELQGAEREAAVHNLSKAIMAAIIAMTPEIGARVAADKAAEFRTLLAEVLSQMTDATDLILDDTVSGYYVQFDRDASLGVRAEAVSNQYQPPVPLTAAQEAQLEALGWAIPGAPETPPQNYRREWDNPVSWDEVAECAVRTLWEVYGVRKAAQLRYKSFAYSGAQKWQPILLPTLGLDLLEPPVMPDEEPPIYLDAGRNADWLRTLYWDGPRDVAGFHRQLPFGIDPNLPSAEPFLRGDDPELVQLLVDLERAGYPAFSSPPTEPPAPPVCPKCGADKTARIAYGMPLGEDMFAAEKRGEIVFGGCLTGPDSPTWHCAQCQHEWGDGGMDMRGAASVSFGREGSEPGGDDD